MRPAGRKSSSRSRARRRRDGRTCPRGIFQREGLRLGDLTPAQRAAVMTLLSTALSRTAIARSPRSCAATKCFARPRSARGRGAGAGRRWRRRRGGRPDVRRGRILPRVPRHAVGDRAVDAAVRRSSSGDQPHAGGEPGEHDAQPARRAAGDLHVRGPDVRPLGNENDKAFALVNALDAAQRSAGRSSTTACADLVLGAGPGRQDDSARGHSGVGAHRRRSRRCCWTSCGNGPAS